MLKSEFAPAKINLTLEVLGRRPDGYHEIRSLVAFAPDVGDRLTLGGKGGAATLTTGAFSGDLAGGNLVDKAVAAVMALLPDLDLDQLTLEKNLPVASGIGGGSADAAAALRLLRTAYPQIAALDLSAIARTLGADVPVCLRSRAAVMTGTGESIEGIAMPDDLFAVLANPLASVPADKTTQVFAMLSAGATTGPAAKEKPPEFSSAQSVIAYAARRGNSLQTPSRKLFPVIDVVLAELTALPGTRLAQLSGAGPTCFALFENARSAEQGAAELQTRHPGWWIRMSRLA